MRATLALMLALAAASGLAAELDRTPLEAQAADGQKVRLFPNGRWEYVDTAKATAAAAAILVIPIISLSLVDALSTL